MQKEKFITVMAIFDEDTQARLRSIKGDLNEAYGEDTHIPDTPFHITLGSYAPEDTERIAARIIDVCRETTQIPVRFSGLNHFGNVVHFLELEISEELYKLHLHFDSDYANGYPGWMPHATVYRHREPVEIRLSQQIIDKIGQLQNTRMWVLNWGNSSPPGRSSGLCLEVQNARENNHFGRTTYSGRICGFSETNRLRFPVSKGAVRRENRKTCEKRHH